MLTEKKAYIMSARLWMWLYKNPNKDKHDYPKYRLIVGMMCLCPLCELYVIVNYKEENHNRCKNCVGDRGLSCFSGAFSRWASDAVTIEQRKHAAAYIAAKIRRKCQKNGWKV